MAGLSLAAATTVMITTMMGCGVIFMPSAMRNLGYLQGPLILGLISFFSFYTLYAISYVAYIYRKMSISKEEIAKSEELKEIENNTENYEDEFPTKERIVRGASKTKISYYAIAETYSPILALLVDLCMMVQGLGSCISYLMVMAEWITSLIGSDKIHRYALIAIIILPLYALAMQKNLRSLKYASVLSVASVFYLLVLLLYYSFILKDVKHEDLGTVPLKKFENKYYKAMGVIIFALGCHQNIVQVFSELENKSVKEITLVSLLCVIGGSSIYLLIGLAGYYIAGHNLKSFAILKVLLDKEGIRKYIETNTWDKNGYAIQLGVLAFLCVITCAFPMQMHPARDAFVNIIGKTKALRDRMGDEVYVQRLRYIVTTSFCLGIGLLGLKKDLKYETVVGVIGATATNAITYMFPAIIYCMCVRKLNLKTSFACFVGTCGVSTMLYLLYNMFIAKQLADD